MTHLLPLEAFRAFPVAKRIAEAAGQPVLPTWTVEPVAKPTRLAPWWHRLLRRQEPTTFQKCLAVHVAATTRSGMKS